MDLHAVVDFFFLAVVPVLVLKVPLLLLLSGKMHFSPKKVLFYKVWLHLSDPQRSWSWYARVQMLCVSRSFMRNTKLNAGPYIHLCTCFKFFQWSSIELWRKFIPCFQAFSAPSLIQARFVSVTNVELRQSPVATSSYSKSASYECSFSSPVLPPLSFQVAEYATWLSNFIGC